MLDWVWVDGDLLDCLAIYVLVSKHNTIEGTDGEAVGKFANSLLKLGKIPKNRLKMAFIHMKYWELQDFELFLPPLKGGLFN